MIEDNEYSYLKRLTKHPIWNKWIKVPYFIFLSNCDWDKSDNWKFCKLYTGCWSKCCVHIDIGFFPESINWVVWMLKKCDKKIWKFAKIHNFLRLCKDLHFSIWSEFSRVQEKVKSREDSPLENLQLNIRDRYHVQLKVNESRGDQMHIFHF